MQRSIVVVTSLGIVMASASLAPGCVFGDAECAQLSKCPPGDPPLGGPGGGGGEGGGGETLEPDCVPSANNANAIAASCGVFVRTSGDDNYPGTPSAPVQTLAKAIMIAGKVMPIYACAEKFPGKVIAPAGTTLYGGLDCEAGWTYGGGTMKTTIEPDIDAMTATQIALVLSSGVGKTHIENVSVIAHNAVMPGGSSIAALIDGVNAELVGCELAAGDGMAGAKGKTPSASIGPSDPKDPTIRGENGTAACSVGIEKTPGGAGATNPMCISAMGGNGGHGHEEAGGDGGDGEPAPSPNPVKWGVGGHGDSGDGNGGVAGSDGQIGMNGSSGAGAPLSSEGALSSSGFIGAAGEPGTEAGPGQGGGGGGGGRGRPSPICYGASGAGGGAGGCGGKGGLGGQGGGASIALASVNATVMLKDVVLSSSNGGDGGDGGDGQAGGTGGEGGDGGDGTPVLKASGRKGGNGGNGGLGGTGGGGRGGPSVGIAYTGPAPAMEGGSITKGIPGKGGAGADAMGAGAAGVEADMLKL